MSKTMTFNYAVLALVVALKFLVPLTTLRAADAAAKPAETAQPAEAAAPAAAAPADSAAAPAAEAKPYSEQGLLDAAYDFCATVQNRHAKSCDCEQKLLKQPERFGQEEREMAFYYFTNKPRYIKEFESRRTADPKWQEDFGLRMSNMEALIIAACGA